MAEKRIICLQSLINRVWSVTILDTVYIHLNRYERPCFIIESMFKISWTTLRSSIDKSPQLSLSIVPNCRNNYPHIPLGLSQLALTVLSSSRTTEESNGDVSLIHLDTTHHSLQLWLWYQSQCNLSVTASRMHLSQVFPKEQVIKQRNFYEGIHIFCLMTVSYYMTLWRSYQQRNWCSIWFRMTVSWFPRLYRWKFLIFRWIWPRSIMDYKLIASVIGICEESGRYPQLESASLL